MKRIKIYIAASAVIATAALLQSCAMETPFGEGGEGSLSINTEIKGETKQTRAENNLDNAEYVQTLKDKCVVFIENSKGVMRKYKGLSNVPSSIKLSSGNYLCEAWTGDSVAASFDSKYYRGETPFEIVENQTTPIELTCNIANVVVSIDAASVAETGLKNPKITFTSSRGSLEFDETMMENQKGYFMIPYPGDNANYTAENRTITVKIEGTTQDGTAYTKEQNIENVERAHEYQVKLSAKQPEIGEGGALIQIVILDIPIIEDTVEIFPAPIVKGYGFDLSEQIVNTDKSFTDQKLYICEYKGTKSVQMSFSENFAGMTDGDLLNNTYVEQLASQGINVESTNSKAEANGEEVPVYEMYVTLPASFLNSLATSSTQYTVTITATDARNLVTTAALRIANTNDAIEKIDDVIADPTPDTDANPMAVLATKATLTGTLYKADAARYGFKYRKAGTSDWSEAVANGANGAPRRTRANKGTAYTVNLTGLEAGTTYEFKAFADAFESATIQTFTTEAKYVIPNASFEDWSTYTFKNKQVKFPGTGDTPTQWSSGNAGGAIAGITMTQEDESVKHSGKYSARLASASAMGVLAAGNIFLGDFVGIENVTKGILNLGRTYNQSHPTKVRVWANYRPGAVNKTASGCPLVEGQPDHGQVYVALTASTVEIHTKDVNTLFNPNGDYIVAYGQVTWEGTNFGDDNQLSLLEIPLEYKERAKTVRPTHLVIVAAASKYGDYYAGSDKSVMYLDDFELVYE